MTLITGNSYLGERVYFVKDLSTLFQRLLVHSKSRTVIATLVEAHVRMNKRFKVYVTESSTGKEGQVSYCQSLRVLFEFTFDRCGMSFSEGQRGRHES